MMKKRLFSLLLALALCLTLLPTAAFAAGAASTAWDGTTATQPYGAGTSDDQYLISTAAELAWLGTLAADGTYYVKLTADIVLNDGTFDADGNFTKTGEDTTSTPVSWTPLPKASWRIDGNNKTISGMYIGSRSDDMYEYGFISYLYRGEIKDLTIKNSYVGLTRNNGKIGVFAGESRESNFANCAGESNIFSTNCLATGGIVGWSYDDTFNSVHSSGSISGKKLLGGLVGRVDYNSVFRNCWNEMSIAKKGSSEANGDAGIGGITGRANGTATFYNCANIGSLNGSSRVGGIIGQVDGSTVKLENCYSLKSITNYASEHVWTGGGYDVYRVGTLTGMGSLTVIACYAEDGFERSDTGEAGGTVPHFTGKGKLTEDGNDNGLMAALNAHLYEMNGDTQLRKWVRDSEGYPLPNGEAFVDETPYYDIWLKGVRVSERNANDILGNGLASYDATANTLTLLDGLTVEGAYYGNSLLYVKGPLDLCIKGKVEFRSDLVVSGTNPIIIQILSDGDRRGDLKIYAPQGETATLLVDGRSYVRGISVKTLTLGGDINLILNTAYACCINDCDAFTFESSQAVLDAICEAEEDDTTTSSMRECVKTINLPSSNPQKLYEGTGNTLICVEQFTTGVYECTMKKHIRIAPDAFALTTALPDSLTVSMATANTVDDVLAWATTEVRKDTRFTTANSEITVSNVTPAMAGSYTDRDGTNGSFRVTVKITESGVSKTHAIPGAITATSYVAPTITAGIRAGRLDAGGNFTADADGIFTSGDGIVFAVTYTANGTAVKTLTGGTVSCFGKTKTLSWDETNGCYLTEAFIWPTAKTEPYTAEYSIGDNNSEYTQKTGSMSVSVQGSTLSASDFTFVAPTDLTYDGGAKAASVTFNGDDDHRCGTVSVKYYDQSGDPVDGTPKDAGTYTVKITVAASEYYQEATTALGGEDWTFTIVPKTLTGNDLEFTESTYTKVYDGTTDTTATVRIKDSAKGSADDELPTITGSCAYNSKDVASASKVSFTTTAQTSSANYVLPANITVEHAASITKATPTITTNPAASVTYGDTVSDSALTGGAASVAGSFRWSGGVSSYGDASTGKTLYAEFVPTDSGNYNTVGSIPVRVAVAQKGYGDKTASGSAYYGASASVALDSYLAPGGAMAIGSSITDSSGALDGNATLSGTTLHYRFRDDASLAESTVTIPVQVTSTNYQTYTITVTLTVVAKPPQSDFGFAAATQRKTYGDADFTVTATGEVEDSSVSYTRSAPAVATVDPVSGTIRILGAGSATITATASATSDYARATASYTLTVDPATVTITVADKSVYMNSTAPDLSAPVLGEDYTVDGLIGADALLTPPTLSYDPEPDMGAESDTTLIHASGADAGDNYTITYVDGKLTITRRPVPATSGKHHITVDDAENGSVTVDPSGAREGETVSITVTPDAGYAVEDITITDRNGNKVKFTRKGDKYTFEMPETGVTIRVKFSDNRNPFVDVTEDHYFYDAVLWAVESGITGGTDATHFSPYATCTRAHIITFLWRAAGCPEPKRLSGFSDVPEDAYYARAVAWAVEQNITGGVTDEIFAPGMPCTRAQAVTFLFRYAQRMGGLDAMTMQELISGYGDADRVPTYAVSAFHWALASGVVTGNNGDLLPSGFCTRAQIVTMLYRFLAK